MAKYINVTFEAATTSQKQLAVDLRIPTNINVSQVIALVNDGLKSCGTSLMIASRQVVRVETKDLVIFDNQIIGDYPVTNGDILKLLN